MEEDLVESGRRELEGSRRHLDWRDGGKLVSVLEGPFVQHNYLVWCWENLHILNKTTDHKERLWKIFPTGGQSSRPGDACAIFTWIVLLLAPAIAICVGCYCSQYINIVTAIVVCVVMTLELILVYVIFQNGKKFKQLWFVSKVNMTHYLGWQNQVKNVSLTSVNDLNLLSAGQRKGVIIRLAGLKDGHVFIMICSKSFWRSRVLYPVISLILLSALGLAALMVQLEMMRR